MRMKEVCARTGLTDRAVRLYIESELVSPTCERSYSGRLSIHFDEADVAALEIVAALRRAGFAIPDIKAMQDDPACIPAAVARQREALRGEIAAQGETLAALEQLGEASLVSTAALAAGLRASAPSTSVPKEDNGMSIKEINRILRTRLAAVLALVAAAVGAVNLARLTYEGCFVRLELDDQLVYRGRDGHGPYSGVLDFDQYPLGEILLAWLPFVLLLTCAVLLFCYIARGKVWMLFAAMGCILVCAGLLFALPAEIAQRFRFQEFSDYRWSFLYRIYRPQTTEGRYAFGATFKFIPLALSLGCGVRALMRHRDVT